MSITKSSKRKAYIGRVEIAGNAETRDHVIRREFEVAEKELSTGKTQTESGKPDETVFEPGLQLEQQSREREDNVIDILTRLTEAQTGTFQAQSWLQWPSGFSGGLQLSKGNILGTGRTLRLSAQFAERTWPSNSILLWSNPGYLILWYLHRYSSGDGSDSTGLNLGMTTENTYGFSLAPRLLQGFETFIKVQCTGPYLWLGSDQCYQTLRFSIINIQHSQSSRLPRGRSESEYRINPNRWAFRWKRQIERVPLSLSAVLVTQSWQHLDSYGKAQWGCFSNREEREYLRKTVTGLVAWTVFAHIPIM